MFTKSRLIIAFMTLALIVAGSQAVAATIDSSAFDLDPANKNINTAGMLDWGYFVEGAYFLDGDPPINTPYDDLKDDDRAIDPATNSKASPAIGLVTITEDSANGIEPSGQADYSGYTFTFTDGLAPAAGTAVATTGTTNGVAPSEDIITINFNDIGAGSRIVSLYMGHSATNRIFDVDANLTATDGDASTTNRSSAIGGTGGDRAFVYQIQVTTADANADLALSITSISGSSGSFQFAGYSVENVPEPSSMALLGLGALLIARRRRKTAIASAA
jgi:hypothetical protein